MAREISFWKIAFEDPKCANHVLFKISGAMDMDCVGGYYYVQDFWYKKDVFFYPSAIMNRLRYYNIILNYSISERYSIYELEDIVRISWQVNPDYRLNVDDVSEKDIGKEVFDTAKKLIPEVAQKVYPKLMQIYEDSSILQNTSLFCVPIKELEFRDELGKPVGFVVATATLKHTH
ncbi:hypothetical protein [Hydrogenobacter thermophilus]|uniref:hypothetical protein n=1 Tax=Hydrogenobacter thermophilus TaxID=940 RepID=UPI0030F87573